MLPSEVDKVYPMNAPVAIIPNGSHICHITVPSFLERGSTDECLRFALQRPRTISAVLVWWSIDQKQFQWNRLRNEDLNILHKLRQEDLRV